MARSAWPRGNNLAESVLRATDKEAVRLAKTLLRTARFGALAVLDPLDAGPLVSRVAVACDSDGAPTILVSGLAAHTAALHSDERCSLLVGEPGKGDALAYPRLTVRCRARPVGNDRDGDRLAARFLRHVPKAALYAQLPDFRYFRLEPLSAALNGGFGKAYALSGSDLLVENGFSLAEFEASILGHMNEDHAEAVSLCAERLAAQPSGAWTMTGIDPEGADLAWGDQTARIWFDHRVNSRIDARTALLALVRVAQAVPPNC